MQTRIVRWFGLTALLAAAGLTAALMRTPAAGAQGTPAVSVLPASGTFAVGVELPVEVWVEDVSDLYGAEVHLSFDPARMEVVDADPNTGGVQVTPRSDLLVPGFVIQQTSNISGTIQYSISQMQPSPPVSGSGALFAFTVNTLSAGPAGLTITTHLLSTVDAEPIAADAHHASYLFGTMHQLFVPLIRR